MALGDLDFRVLFEGAPDIVLVLLPDAPRFTMVAATRARFAATHTGPDSLGKGLFEVFPDNPDDPSATGLSNLRESLNRVLATRAPDSMAVQKYDIRGPDGSFEARYWSPRNIPLVTSEGTVRYIYHRVEDVTELVRASELGDELRDRTREMEREVLRRSQELAVANRSLRDANARLGELDTAKTAFFSNVSHEFRTPLTLMLGPLEDSLADREEALTVTQRTRARLAHDNALRLLKLVNGLLDFSRMEEGRLRARFAPADLSALTARLAGMFESAAGRTRLKLTIDCPPLPDPVWVDREMWEKIVSNLVSNAIKFTHEGEVTVRVRATETSTVLEVADTGIGIPRHEISRVFERFHRVEGAAGRAYDGTGIGLSLVHDLVRLHGGRVSVESVLGEGSSFRVEIPRGFAHLPAEQVSTAETERDLGEVATAHVIDALRWVGTPGRGPDTPYEGSAPQGDGRALILVVDDNADLRTYLSTLLAPLYEVRTAVDGVEALASIRATPPDLVLSDVMMPHLDGFGLLQALRADDATASIPVILLSARAGEESAIEGLVAGADDYLAKPFSARELLARVKTHIDLARLRRRFVTDLENANRALDDFAHSVSHDLRSPLRAIAAFTGILAEDHAAQLDAQGNGLLREVAANAARMAAMTDALLDLGKISRGPLRAEALDLSGLAQRALDDLRREEPGRTVTALVEPGLVAHGDPALIAIVVSNLLSNAWKYTSRVEAAVIEVGSVPAHEPTFFVRDNGAGFSMREANRLFIPFHRLHAQTEFPGTGVGLATVKRALERHRGRIWVESAPDKGATFTFTVPTEAVE